MAGSEKTSSSSIWISKAEWSLTSVDRSVMGLIGANDVRRESGRALAAAAAPPVGDDERSESALPLRPTHRRRRN